MNLTTNDIAYADKVSTRLCYERGYPFELREDLIAVGRAGLVEAATTYDDSEQASFHTFAWHRIRGAIQDEIREWGGWRDKSRREAIILELNDNSLELSVNGIEKTVAVKDCVYKRLGRLTKREIKILQLYCVEGLTIYEIGDIFGVTGTRILQIKKKALRKARACLP